MVSRRVPYPSANNPGDVSLVPGAAVLRQGVNLKEGQLGPDYRAVQVVLGHRVQGYRRAQLRDDDSGRGGEGVRVAVKAPTLPG